MKRRLYDYDAILRYIIDTKLATGGDSPSTQNIMDKFGIPSTSSVASILSTLEREGHIQLLHESGQPRRIKVKGLHILYLPDFTEASRNGNGPMAEALIANLEHINQGEK